VRRSNSRGHEHQTAQSRALSDNWLLTCALEGGALLNNAKLRQAATIENVDYRTARGLDRSLFHCGLGHKACPDGFSVLYKRASRLFADLAQARGKGRLARLIASVNLLILDDWGPEPLATDQRSDLLEIVDDRYDKGSLLITSQVPVCASLHWTHNRTCRFPASGLYGAFFVKGASRHFCRPFVIPFFCSSRAASILPSRPHISIAVARPRDDPRGACHWPRSIARTMLVFG
jgi:hypothetical protein